MVQLTDYNLPDIGFVEKHSQGVFTWTPDAVYVVLGQRDKPETALAANLPDDKAFFVTKRPSGGHSVVLTPNTLVVSIHGKSPDITKTKQWFQACSNAILNSLHRCGLVDAHISGISDITINNRKILGSSMYRGKDKVWWHGVLNISENPAFISSFLAHPATEPDYRKQRNHEDFITSIVAQGLAFNASEFEKYLTDEISNTIIPST
ncbi:MAG TPA: hypothetical protein PLZ52_07105 [Bacteroidales bacterium]|mgnify:FL=1|nr:hypothetical protein [Bacteroidales bacterium]HQL69543.1 hypothetical protein [Bacteroidales bacterium]